MEKIGRSPVVFCFDSDSNLPMPNIINVCELTRRFELPDRDVIAADSISFHVQAGEVFGLLGPNGAGKTTCMRMILGLLKANSGYAEIHGFRSDEQPEEVKRRVGFVSSSAGVYQWLTAHEMLSFFGDVYGMSTAECDSRIDELSELLGFEEFLNRRCAGLSTGEKQRINLARAMIHDPSVMIFDEPTLGLDVVGSQVIFRHIDLLREQGKAVILCTHRLEQAQRVCDRFGLLHHGELVLGGTLADLQQKTGRQDLVEIFVDIIEGTFVSAETSTS
jgi:ABC-2 type transport system ATP-binding protein/sodium transport system ATP-binding protein